MVFPATDALKGCYITVQAGMERERERERGIALPLLNLGAGRE
jgi:hypothetical protein